MSKNFEVLQSELVRGSSLPAEWIRPNSHKNDKNSDTRILSHSLHF